MRCNSFVNFENVEKISMNLNLLRTKMILRCCLFLCGWVTGGGLWWHIFATIGTLSDSILSAHLELTTQPLTTWNWLIRAKVKQTAARRNWNWSPELEYRLMTTIPQCRDVELTRQWRLYLPWYRPELLLKDWPLVELDKALWDTIFQSVSIFWEVEDWNKI